MFFLLLNFIKIKKKIFLGKFKKKKKKKINFFLKNKRG
jgi:hypothetical protein